MIVLSTLGAESGGRFSIGTTCDLSVRIEHGAVCTGCAYKLKSGAAARFIQDPKDRKTGKVPPVKILCRACYTKRKAAA